MRRAGHAPPPVTGGESPSDTGGPPRTRPRDRHSGLTAPQRLRRRESARPDARHPIPTTARCSSPPEAGKSSAACAHPGPAPSATGGRQMGAASPPAILQLRRRLSCARSGRHWSTLWSQRNASLPPAFRGLEACSRPSGPIPSELGRPDAVRRRDPRGRNRRWPGFWRRLLHLRGVPKFAGAGSQQLIHPVVQSEDGIDGSVPQLGAFRVVSKVTYRVVGGEPARPLVIEPLSLSQSRVRRWSSRNRGATQTTAAASSPDAYTSS